jgi:hypothetical protein
VVVAGLWLVAVLGAATILISPITPWMVPLEILGGVVCLVATIALAARFHRG